MTTTRFPELAYEKHDRNLWRIIATEDGCATGPFYRTRSELLADLDRFAREYGCTAETQGTNQ